MFQIIVGAGVGHKDVHDAAGIIQQHPVLGVEALGGVGLDALLRKLVLHLVGQLDKESDDAILSGDTDVAGATTTDGQPANS